MVRINFGLLKLRGWIENMGFFKNIRYYPHRLPNKNKVSNKKGLKDYIIEIVIFLLSIIIAVGSFFIVDLQYAVTIFIVIQSSNIVIISLKNYLDIVIDKNQKKNEDLIVSLFDEGFNFKDILMDSKWEELKKVTREKYFNRISGLHKGKIELTDEELLYYQNSLIHRSKEQLYAIHIADTEESLKLWDPLRNDDSKFKKASYYACKDLPKGIDKRRLFFVHKDSIKTNENNQFLQLFNRVVLDQQKVLGFLVRYLYIDEVVKHMNIPFDKIISDGEEVFEIQMREGRVYLASAYIDPRLVKDSMDEFNNLWDMADEWKAKTSFAEESVDSTDDNSNTEENL